jgi:hypothetical protein
VTPIDARETAADGGLSPGPFRSEWHRRTQKRLDVVFGSFVTVVATVGMGVVAYLISDERAWAAVLAGATTLSLLALGAWCAHRGWFGRIFAVLSTLVFAWAVVVVVTDGRSWIQYFLAFNAEMAFFNGGRVYRSMIAKWVVRR